MSYTYRTILLRYVYELHCHNNLQPHPLSPSFTPRCTAARNIFKMSYLCLKNIYNIYYLIVLPDRICHVMWYVIFFDFFLLKERLKENECWQLCCQVIPNSLIRTSPVQVLEVSHNMVVDLPFEGLQVIL